MHRILHLLVLSALICGLPSVCCAIPNEEGEGAKKTLYGMFRQTRQGGIEFVSPQEPEVVYLPFDAASILDNFLNIQVEVHGEIRDSFQRNGKTVRILAVADIHPLTAEYGATRITKSAAVGLPGTASAEVHSYQNMTCFLYDRYAVLETPADYTDGHTLRLLARTEADAPAAVCENRQGRPLFEIPNGGDFTFAGMAGDTLFVVNGPADATHGLMAVNVATKKQTLDATVTPGTALAKGSLSYKEVLPAGRAPSCPAGKTAVRPMALDLASGKATPAGKPACWP